MDDVLFDQRVYVFRTADDRDAALPTPDDGDHAYLLSTDTMTTFTRSGWRD